MVDENYNCVDPDTDSVVVVVAVGYKEGVDAVPMLVDWAIVVDVH